MDFSVAVDIAAPPERVWRIMAEVERWAEWTPSVTSITRLNPGSFRVGSRVRIRQPKMPPAVWKLTELGGQSFTWKTGGFLVSVTAKHWVEATRRGSRASLSLKFGGLLGRPVAWLTRDLNNRYLNLEATGLKQRSESTS